jgi:hypothetical protein
VETVFRRLGLRPWSELTEAEKAAVRRYCEHLAGRVLEPAFYEACWWICRGGDMWEQFALPGVEVPGGADWRTSRLTVDPVSGRLTTRRI